MEVTIAFAVLFKFVLSPQEEIAGVGTQNKKRSSLAAPQTCPMRCAPEGVYNKKYYMPHVRRSQIHQCEDMT